MFGRAIEHVVFSVCYHSPDQRIIFSGCLTLSPIIRKMPWNYNNYFRASVSNPESLFGQCRFRLTKGALPIHVRYEAERKKIPLRFWTFPRTGAYKMSADEKHIVNKKTRHAYKPDEGGLVTDGPEQDEPGATKE